MTKTMRTSGNGQYAAKGNAPSVRTFVVRDSKSGRFVEVRGADSMAGKVLPIKKGVDLTKPIAKQVLRGSSRSAKHAKG